MTKPLIGITTKKQPSETYGSIIYSPRSYCEAVLSAGAIPVLIPLNLPIEILNDLVNKIDGLLITGGGDIAIEHFEGLDHPKIEDVDDERDGVELHLARNIVEIEKPFLGICRGLQIFNVAFGGTLYTHLADQINSNIQHSKSPEHPWKIIAHSVKVTEGSRLSEIVDESILEVNSLHHQGIKTLSNRFDSVAEAPDGLIEAIELKDYPFGLAVQWHPEWLLEDQNMRSIFESFVSAASMNNK